MRGRLRGEVREGNDRRAAERVELESARFGGG
jgi:hypothetical protein